MMYPISFYKLRKFAQDVPEEQEAEPYDVPHDEPDLPSDALDSGGGSGDAPLE